MKKTSLQAAASGRLVVVSLLAAGFLLAGSGPSYADRDGYKERHDYRHEQRRESRNEGRHDGRFEKRVEHRQKVVVRNLPRGYKTVVVNKTPYFVHEHRYYTRGSGGYVLVRPPVGAVFATLPLGSVSLTIGGNFFYRADDVFYRPSPRGYVVVAPPAQGGAVMVWTSALNVRTGPGEHFPVVGRAWQGETLFVNGHAPGWYYVLLPNGASGWVMSGYTRPLAAG